MIAARDLRMHNELLVASQRPVRSGDCDRSSCSSVGHRGADIGGVDKCEGRWCSVEVNLAFASEVLSQDLHQRARAPIGWEVSQKRGESCVEAEEDTLIEPASGNRTSIE